MKNVVTFSGWGQKHNALDNIAPGAKHIDYKNFDDVKNLFNSLKGTECDTVIGWSLGGQVALRAIESGVLKPKLLVLLSTPFQFITDNGLKCGIDADSFNVFEDEFTHDPVKTLKQFSLLIARGDKNVKEVSAKLKNVDTENASKWLYWLGELRNFSCQSMGYTNIPKTLAITGRDDNVVDATQIDLFRPLIKGYKSQVFEKCGHAPHLHDEVKVISLIKSAL